MNKIIKKYDLKKEETDTGMSITVDITIDNFHQIDREIIKIKSALKTSSHALTLIPRNLVVSLVSQYDAFLGNLLAAIYLKKPDILNLSEKNIGIKELLLFGNIEEAKEFVIEKEIESILREGHVKQFSILENIFKIPLTKDLPIWPIFVEFTQRRNLFVHCGGVVASQYMKVCTENGLKADNEHKIGQNLEVSPDYLESGFNCIFEIGVKLAHVLWRKIFPEEIELADANLNNEIIYNLLTHENYHLAKIFADFACNTLKKHCNDVRRRMFIINQAIAYKFSGEDDTAKKILMKEDWSASDIVFKFGVEILNDNFEKAGELMKLIGTGNEWINKECYSTWPLFKEFRKNDIFRNIYKEIFQQSYEQTEIVIKDDEQLKLFEKESNP